MDRCARDVAGQFDVEGRRERATRLRRRHDIGCDSIKAGAVDCSRRGLVKELLDQRVQLCDVNCRQAGIDKNIAVRCGRIEQLNRQQVGTGNQRRNCRRNVDGFGR